MSAGYHEAVDAARRAILTEALVAAGGHRTRAAEALGLERTYLQRLIRQLGVRVPWARPKEDPR